MRLLIIVTVKVIEKNTLFYLDKVKIDIEMISPKIYKNVAIPFVLMAGNIQNSKTLYPKFNVTTQTFFEY